MKLIQILAGVLLSTGGLLAQQTQENAEAEITFHVITDNGQPVSNVEVTASTFLRWQLGEGFGKDIYQDIKGRTNEKGLVTIRFNSQRGDCRYGVLDASGYYPTRGLLYQFKGVKGGKWQPLIPIVDLVLKPILNPIPMYARRIGELPAALKIPVLEKAVGFDLMVGDWVAPHGKGSIADLLFTLIETLPYKSAKKTFAATLTISFSNKGDGIQSVLAPINQGSRLRLPRYAPQDGYEATLVKNIGRPVENKPIDLGTREDQNYFFRVRTLLDNKGNIKRALYGKFDGDIRFWGNRHVRFSYYLNPNSNDRNMEFDLKKNLFGDLPSSQRQSQP